MSTLPPERMAQLARVERWSLGIGIAALAVCLVGALFSPAQFFRAYLAAYLFWLGIALGSFAILMLYHLTGGAWGFLLRGVFEASMRTLPLLAVLFAPIAVGVPYLYSWANPEEVAASLQLRHNHLYLNAPFWWIRAALFFASWIVLAYVVSAWSREQDRTGERTVPRKFRLLAGPALVVYGLTITFASVDWTMSLDPKFYSTIWGPLFASGQLVSAMAFTVLVLGWLLATDPLQRFVSLEVLNDVGNLLFTFLVIWAYMAFFQFMLIWMANLRREVIWYLPRSRGGWQWVAWAVFLFHFAVPFFLLLLRDVKRSPAALMRVAALLLFMRLVYLYWEIMPNFPGTTIAEHWMDFLTPFAVGGPWLAYFLWQLKRYPVLPLHDINQEEAEHLRRMDQEEAARREAMSHG
jgi:hypothetical protein